MPFSRMEEEKGGLSVKNDRKRILFADPNRTLFTELKSRKGITPYHLEYSSNGNECLKKIETFLPELVVIDLMLPHIHGIEILRKIKTDPRTNHIGVIVTCAHALIQNYHTAINHEGS